MVKYTKKEIEALATKKRVIYMIHNKVNGKKYVGQTIKTFNGRYPGNGIGAERVLGNTNEHLERSLLKYGVENFKVTLLETDIESIDELNKLEKYYIQKYNCLIHGYNTDIGGNNVDNTWFYALRKEIKQTYLDILTLDSVLNNNYEKYGNGFFVKLADGAISCMGCSFDYMEDYAYNTIRYYKKCAEERIDEILSEMKENGVNISLENILMFYNLIEG